jgi:hypothetical protein
MIEIQFSVETEIGLYNDTIVLPDDHQLTKEEIEAIKVQRVENWKAFVEQMSVESQEPIADNSNSAATGQE